MRHNKQKRSSFGRHGGPRKALIKSLINSLVQHERIKTTLSKAKTVRPLVERAITMGKRGDIHSRRLLFSRYHNKTTVEKIMNTLAIRFKERPGGYTRIIKLGFRAGDQAPLAYIEFVDYGAQKGEAKQDVIQKVPLNKDTKQADNKEQKKLATTKKVESQKTIFGKKNLSDKKFKKQLLNQADKQRKKSRLTQKKSRRTKRP